MHARMHTACRGHGPRVSVHRPHRSARLARSPLALPHLCLPNRYYRRTRTGWLHLGYWWEGGGVRGECSPVEPDSYLLRLGASGVRDEQYTSVTYHSYNHKKLLARGLISCVLVLQTRAGALLKKKRAVAVQVANACGAGARAASTQGQGLGVGLPPPARVSVCRGVPVSLSRPLHARIYTPGCLVAPASKKCKSLGAPQCRVVHVLYARCYQRRSLVSYTSSRIPASRARLL